MSVQYKLLVFVMLICLCNCAIYSYKLQVQVLVNNVAVPTPSAAFVTSSNYNSVNIAGNLTALGNSLGTFTTTATQFKAVLYLKNMFYISSYYIASSNQFSVDSHNFDLVASNYTLMFSYLCTNSPGCVVYYHLYAPALWAYNVLGFRVRAINVTCCDILPLYKYLNNPQYIMMGQTLVNAPMVIAHEYGHWYMDNVYSSYHPVSTGWDYCHTDAPATAIVEDVAIIFGMLFAGGSNGKFIDGSGALDYKPVEYYGNCNNVGAYTLANEDVFRFAALLWDYFDTNVDSNGGNVTLGASGHSDNNSLSTINAQALLKDILSYYTPQGPDEYVSDLLYHLCIYYQDDYEFDQRGPTEYNYA